MAYQSKTYSLSDEVIAWLGELKDSYGSVNKGLLAVIALQKLDDDEARAQTHEILPPARLTSAPISEIERCIIREEREILNEPSPFADRPKNCFCKHCGKRFAGPKFSTICSECKSSGHTNQPSECPRCNEASAI